MERGLKIIFDPPKTRIAAVSASAVAIHLILRYGYHTPPLWWPIPLYLALIFGAIPLMIMVARKAIRREMGSDLLAGISIAVSIGMGEFFVATILMLMLSGGGAIEKAATRRASSVLEALAKRMPQKAHRRRGDATQDVELDKIAVGDILIVHPHEICPADGVITQGMGWMDESYLTGEPFQISKGPGSMVLSGAINGEAMLVIEARKRAADSRYAAIMRVMEDSVQSRPRIRRLGDQLAVWYVPFALGLAAVAWALSEDASRFLAVLVAATPCPLIIAIPVAVIGAVSLAAKRSIIIRDPAVLEQVARCRTAVFDKTGTLTYGRPSLTEMSIADGFSRSQILGLAAGLERYSRHPLGGAIIRAAEEAHIKERTVGDVREIPGRGLEGKIQGQTIRIIGRARAQAEGHQLPSMAGGLECAIVVDGKFAALCRFRDAPRPESRSFLDHLPRLHRFRKLMLLSGDQESEVRYLANAVGISEIRAGCSPEDKVSTVVEETRRQPTLFVGDGINDAPALAQATVGVAIGPSCDVASAAAGAVILTPALGKVDELLHIGRRMRVIALESAAGGMALSVIAMTLAAVGRISPIEGAVAQEVIDLIAILNAVRTALPGRLTDF